MPRIAQRLFLALTLAAAGCSEGAGDGPLSPAEARDYANARARWTSSAVRSAYVYEVRTSCFCPDEITRWHTITVIDGVVTDVRNAQGAQPPRPQWASYETVDMLFDRLKTNAESRPELLSDISVTFDPQHGYPVEVTYSYDPGIADAGSTHYARNLRAAARP